MAETGTLDADHRQLDDDLIARRYFEKLRLIYATLPAVLRVLVGRDSTVWLELEERLPEHTWLVLASDGTPWGSVVLPPRSQLAIARRGQLWTLEESPDGFQGIAGFAVR